MSLTALENLAFLGPCEARSAADIKAISLRHASHITAQSVRPGATRLMVRGRGTLPHKGRYLEWVPVAPSVYDYGPTSTPTTKTSRREVINYPKAARIESACVGPTDRTNRKLRARVSEYERGVREPDLIILLRYAKLAGVRMAMLVDDEMELIIPENKKRERQR